MKGDDRAWKSSGRSVCIKNWNEIQRGHLNEIQRGHLCRGDDEHRLYPVCRPILLGNNETDMNL